MSLLTGFKIMISSGIIDFYVDKEKYEKKSKNNKFQYVEEELKKYLSEHIGSRVGENSEIELRDLTVTSNNFWGQDELCIINDIGYSCNNILKLNEDFITIRVFQVDIFAVVPDDFDASNSFITLEGQNHQISISSTKLI